MEDFVSAPWLRRLIAAVVLAGLVELPLAVLATALAHRAGTAP